MHLDWTFCELWVMTKAALIVSHRNWVRLIEQGALLVWPLVHSRMSHLKFLRFSSYDKNLDAGLCEKKICDLSSLLGNNDSQQCHDGFQRSNKTWQAQDTSEWAKTSLVAFSHPSHSMTREQYASNSGRNRTVPLPLWATWSNTFCRP